MYNSSRTYSSFFSSAFFDEKANHLGNVLTVISDKKLPLDQNGDGTVDGYTADVVSTTDYYPFGNPMPGRTFNADLYRYGAANGQERVDEISGSGNHYTAEYWEYDSRIGRRWNIDPVIKANYSSYLTFGNNPIILIDPNGRTDYYNTKGKMIGSDGIDNGEKRMALKKSTQKTIKSATKENMNISLNPIVYTDVVQIPNNETLNQMETMWEDTKKGKEQTMMVGTNASGQETRIVKEGSETNAPSGLAFDEMRESGSTPLYSVHTHPYGAVENEDGTTTVSTPDPSNTDIQAAQGFKSLEPSFNSNGNQQMVIGPSYSYQENTQTGGSELKSTVQISFYNGNNTTPYEPNKPIRNSSTMVPNGAMDFKLFLKAARQANTPKL